MTDKPNLAEAVSWAREELGYITHHPPALRAKSLEVSVGDLSAILTALDQAVAALRPFGEAWTDTFDSDEPRLGSAWETPTAGAVDLDAFRQAASILALIDPTGS